MERGGGRGGLKSTGLCAKNTPAPFPSIQLDSPEDFPVGHPLGRKTHSTNRAGMQQGISVLQLQVLSSVRASPPNNETDQISTTTADLSSTCLWLP